MSCRSAARRAWHLVHRDDGQDLIEYGLLAAFIAIAIITTVGAVGTVIKTRFWDVVANLL